MRRWLARRREAALWAEGWRVFTKMNWRWEPFDSKFRVGFECWRRCSLDIERMERHVCRHGFPFAHVHRQIEAEARRARWRSRWILVCELTAPIVWALLWPIRWWKERYE